MIYDLFKAIYNLFQAFMNDINNTMNDIVIDVVNDKNRVPTQTGKPGKIGGHFSIREKSQGILNNLEKSGKITQNTGKFRDFETNIICYF